MKKAAVLLSILVSIAAGQMEPELEGEIAAKARTDVSWLTVRLRGAGARAETETARVLSDGRFTFHAVPAGAYTLSVLDGGGNEIVQRLLTVGPTNPTVTIDLPEHRRDMPSGETVSAARLMHRPAKPALRAAQRAQQLSRSGDHARAAGFLERAVAADPQFADAYNNLGVEYLRVGRAAEAAAALRRAVALDPVGSVEQTNLAVALAKLGSLSEAETWARAAVRGQGATPAARSVLNSILSAERRSGDAGHLPAPE